MATGPLPAAVQLAMSRHKRLISLAGFLSGLAIVAGLFFHFGVDAVARAFNAMGFFGFSVIVALRLGLIALMGSSWWSLGRGRPDAKAGRFIWGRLMRDSASEVLPLSQVGGFVSGARALTVSGVAGTFAAASTLVDLSVELVAKLPYTLLGLLLLYELRPRTHLIVPIVIGILLLAALALLFVALQSRGAGFGDRLWARLARRWPGIEVSGGETIRDAVFQIRGNRAGLAMAVTGHLSSWFLGGVETWIMLQLMGVPIDLGPAIAIDSLVTTVRSAAFFVPNGVGVQEGGYLLLCGLFGIAPGQALALSLLRRARDWTIGVPALLAWQLMEGQRARPGLFKRTSPRSPGP